MLQAQRQREILLRLENDAFLSTKQLAKEFNVSEMTIRRDFSDLVNLGVIIREHGGAMLPVLDFQEKLSNVPEKLSDLAQAAAALLHDEQCIFIDASNTALELLPYLKNMKITVVTNGRVLGRMLEGFRGEIITLGGTVSNDFSYTYGPLCLNNLASFSFDTCFLSCTGLQLLEKEVHSRDIHSSQIKVSAMQRSKQKVLMVAADKFQQTGFYRFAALSEFDYLVTDYQQVTSGKLAASTKLITVKH